MRNITNVGELIEALQRLPDDMPIGTMSRDYVGEKFEKTVSMETEYVSDSGRMDQDGTLVLAFR